MTSEAPKTVLIVWTKGGKGAIMTKPKDGPLPENMSKSYTLTTHALAMVAAAYEAARNAVIVTPSDYAAPTARITLANAVDRLTPDDAQAALDALLKAEREAGRVDGLREAAETCTRVAKDYDVMEPGKPDTYANLKTQKAAKGMVRLAKQEILALIEKETGYE